MGCRSDQQRYDLAWTQGFLVYDSAAVSSEPRQGEAVGFQSYCVTPVALALKHTLPGKCTLASSEDGLEFLDLRNCRAEPSRESSSTFWAYQSQHR